MPSRLENDTGTTAMLEKRKGPWHGWQSTIRFLHPPILFFFWLAPETALASCGRPERQAGPDISQF